MLKRYETKARIGLWLGFICMSGSITIAWANNPLAPWTPTLMQSFMLSLLCLALFAWGCSLYARAKGQHPWFGALALLGFFGLIGGLLCILVLALLPDKYKSNPDGELSPGPPPPPAHPPAETPPADAE